MISSTTPVSVSKPSSHPDSTLASQSSTTHTTTLSSKATPSSSSLSTRLPSHTSPPNLRSSSTFHHREQLIGKFVDIQLRTDSDVLVNPLELKRKFNEAADARVALYQEYCTRYNKMAAGFKEAYHRKEDRLKALVKICYEESTMTHGQKTLLMIVMSDWKVVDRYLSLPFGDTEEIRNKRENMKAQLFRDILAAKAARRFPITKPAVDRKKAMELVDREPCLSAVGKEMMKERMSKDSGKTFMEWYLYGLPEIKGDRMGLSEGERRGLIWRAWGVEPLLRMSMSALLFTVERCRLGKKEGV